MLTGCLYPRAAACGWADAQQHGTAKASRWSSVYEPAVTWLLPTEHCDEVPQWIGLLYSSHQWGKGLWTVVDHTLISEGQQLPDTNRESVIEHREQFAQIST